MSLISYHPDKGFIVQKPSKNDVRMLGYKTANDSQSIIPEEAVYLVESKKAYVYSRECAIEAHKNKVAPMSMVKLLHIMTQSNVSLAKYKHYRRLVENYIVRPFNELAGISSMSHHNLSPPNICWCPECPAITPDYYVWKIKDHKKGLHSRCSQISFFEKVHPTFRFLVLDQRFSYTCPPLDRIANVGHKVPLFFGRGNSSVVFNVSEIYLEGYENSRERLLCNA